MPPELICVSCGVKNNDPHERWCLTGEAMLGKNVKPKYKGRHRRIVRWVR